MKGTSLSTTTEKQTLVLLLANTDLSVYEIFGYLLCFGLWRVIVNSADYEKNLQVYKCVYACFVAFSGLVAYALFGVYILLTY